MGNVTKGSLSLGVAFATLAFATSALAQAADNSGGGDIIVTARRVEERLQDVPISITVYSQQQLTKQNIAIATDLAKYTPSLSVDQHYGPEKSTFAIRGFNQDQGTAPTVGVYFAEVVGVRAQGGTTSGNTVGAGTFIDLANVQVLKGPQGTLFGRNTTGGAILLTPQKPTDKLEGYVEGSYGNYDQKRLQAALNIPLSDTFKIRISGERNTRDGYMNNMSGVAGSPKAFDDVNYWYGRLSILADLTPDLQNYTVFHYSSSNTHGYASRIIGCAPSPGSGSGVRDLLALSCAIQLARQDARGDSLYDVESGYPGGFLHLHQWQAINTTTWRTSDTLTVKNIISYGEIRERSNFDLATSNFVVPDLETSPIFGPGFDLTRISPFLTTTGGAPGGFPLFAAAGTPYDRIVLDTAGPDTYNSAESTLTEELQLQGNALDGRLNFVIGGYLEFSRPLGFNAGRTDQFLSCTNAALLQCTNPLFIGTISESATKLSFDNHGAFAQASYKFTDQLSLTGGFRYTFDKIVGYTESTRATLDPADRNPNSFIDPVTGVRIARTCTDTFRHSTAVPGLDRSVCGTNLTNSSTAPTWLIDIDYKPTSDLLFYAKYARGYRQGGINFTNPGVETWKPEHMDSYEAGIKTGFHGSVSGYFNIAGFYNKLRDQQVFAQLVATNAAAARGVTGGAGIVNAGKSRVYGVEVDASALFFNSLRLGANYTYLNTKVTAVAPAATACDGSPLGSVICNTDFGQIIPVVQVGSVFTNSPKHKVSLTAEYTLPFDKSVGEVTLGANLVHTSKYINDGASPAYVNGIPLGVSQATNILNLNLDWKSVAGTPVDLALFATNVTNKTYTVANSGFWNAFGSAEIQLGQPRFYGVRIRYSFGE